VVKAIHTDDRFLRARAVLQEHWKYDDFRAGQREVVRAALEDRDVLAILPTGGGKSLCYQVPALVDDGITIVVSPLIALMQDQVDGLRRAGVRAAFMNSTMPARAIDQCWTDLRYGLYKLLYVAPERLTTDDFVARAASLKIHRIAVDEAHCISEWGHNFRPSYLELADAFDRMGRPPVLALTATATPRVRDDIFRSLRLNDPAIIVSGFDRPNIVFSVFHDENKKAHVRRVIEGVGGSGIVYAATRRATESWAEWLRSEGIAARAYHAGLSPEERTAVQNAWISGDMRVVTATNAFGMGIDKPDVRFVIHVQTPASLEAYYQEAGRAGRDGRRSHAVLIFHPSDIAVQKRLIDSSHPPADLVHRTYDVACSMGGVAIGSESDGPLVLDRNTLLKAVESPPGQIDRAIELIERAALWHQVRLDPRAGLLRFTASIADLKRAGARKTGAFEQFIDTVLRSVDGAAFGEWVTVNPEHIGRRAALSSERVERGLEFLEARGLCIWRPARAALILDLCGQRMSRPRLDTGLLQRSLASSNRKLDDMQAYACGILCRRQHLLAYFGERAESSCGKCDVCLGRHREAVVTPEDEPDLRRILTYVREENALPAADERSHALARWLIGNGYLDTPPESPWNCSVTPRGLRYLG
jgi:ATP-dependent DNA helicase RecQ